MPREIKTTLAVDGEQAFKRAIDDANKSIKNMGTQLTLATAEFKKDGDAMKLMQTRSKALNAEIQQQNEIVKALEKAVEDSTKAYGENSEKVEKWEAELNRAKAKLISLENELTLNDAGLDRNGKAFDEGTKAAKDYSSELQSIGKNVSFDSISSGLEKISGGFENAIKKVISFGDQLWQAMAEAASWADDEITLAKIYGVSVEELQQMQYAASVVDVSTDTLAKSRKKLKSAMGSDNAETQDIFTLMGLDIKDDKTGQYMDVMEVFWTAGEYLKNLDDEVAQNEQAMKLFGRSWDELLPMFSAGRETYEKAMGDAAVVTEENVTSLGELQDQIDKLRNQWDTAKLTLFAEIADPFKEVAGGLSDLLQQFNEWTKTEEGKKAIDGLAAAITELFSGLKDISFQDAIETVKNGINRIGMGLNWLKENKSSIETALTVIAGAFGAIKVAQLATNIGKIVSGFQTLWAGANNPLPSMPGSETGVGTAATGGSFLSRIGSGIAGASDLIIPGVSLLALAEIGKNMINANLNDENLNMIYGDDEGRDILDRMTEKEWKLARRYERLNETQYGSEEAMDAREALQQALLELGIQNDEQGISLIENIFEEKLNGTDIDGLVEKYNRMAAAILGEVNPGWAMPEYLQDAAANTYRYGYGGSVRAGTGYDDAMRDSRIVQMINDSNRNIQEKTQKGVEDAIKGVRIYLDGDDVTDHVIVNMAGREDLGGSPWIAELD